MHCNSCGSEVKEHYQFCSRCGYWLDAEENSKRNRELMKTFLFLITTFVILFVIIYRIHSDFDSFISHQLPMQLSTEDTAQKILGTWTCEDDKGVFDYIKFEGTKFELNYTEEGRSMSGTYSIEDSNTLILYISMVNDDSIPEDLDMVHKFHFEDDDTLVVIFNGITNVFKRQI